MKRKNVFIQLNHSKIDSCFFYSIFVNTPFQIAYLQLNKTFRPLVRILWICSVLLLGASFLAGIIEWSRMLLISIRFISHGLSIPIDWADWSRLEMIVPAHACALRRTVPLFPCPDSFIRILHYYCCYAVRPSCSRRKKNGFQEKIRPLLPYLVQIGQQDAWSSRTAPKLYSIKLRSANAFFLLPLARQIRLIKSQ